VKKKAKKNKPMKKVTYGKWLQETTDGIEAMKQYNKIMQEFVKAAHRRE